MSRRFHDPWGNKYHNRYGAITHAQYMVGKSELSNKEYYGYPGNSVNYDTWYFDKPTSYENNKARYIRTGRHSSESMRR
jgi:hypothetical protein